MLNLGLKKTFLGKFRGKFEILSTHNLLCQKFVTVCWKIATYCPGNDAAEYKR